MSCDAIINMRQCENSQCINHGQSAVVYIPFNITKSACHNGCFKVPHPTTPHPNYPHYCGVIMGAMTSQITSLNIFCSTAYSGADQRKHQRSTLLVFVWIIHRWPIHSPYKCPITRKMLPFDDVIMAQNQSFFLHKMRCHVLFSNNFPAKN